MNLLAVHQFIGDEWSYPENDCWAVFCKAAAAVFGIDVPHVDVPPQPDYVAAAGLFERHAAQPHWCELDTPAPGCAVLFRDRSGAVAHIGLYVQSGCVLHCMGSPSQPGQTRYDDLAVIRRLFSSVQYFQYDPDSSNP